jgi:hypothetical protein
LVCGEGIAAGESTLAACGTKVDVKLKARLEVSAGAALTESAVVNVVGTPAMEFAVAWDSLMLIVDMTCGSGTLEATMP